MALPKRFDPHWLYAALAIAAIIMASHPYSGIINDSRFYAVQALREIHPGRYHDDLYFQFGSQGRFTIFTALYTPVIQLLGLSRANFVLTIVGDLLWFMGLYKLTSALIPNRAMVFPATAMAAAIPSSFIIIFGPPTLTPRLFSEAITLMALAAFFRSQRITSLALMFVALIIHPLMALAGIGVLIIYEAVHSAKIWIFVALATVITFFLAFVGVQPFGLLLTHFGRRWLHIVKIRDYFCFVTKFGLAEWLPLINILLLLGIVGITLSGKQRKIALAVGIVIVGGMVVSLIGGDIMKNVLIVDIQLWRCQWLGAIFLGILSIPTFRSLSALRPVRVLTAKNLFCLAVVLEITFQFFHIFVLPATVIAFLAFIITCQEELFEKSLSLIAEIICLVFVGVVVIASIYWEILLISRNIQYYANWWHPFIGFLVVTVALVVVLFGQKSCGPSEDVHAVSRKSFPWAQSARSFSAVVLVVTASFNWNQETAWTQFLISSKPPQSLAVLLPRTGSIYWQGDVRVPWLLLRRASYFSAAQGTGALFYHGTALAYYRRVLEFERLGRLDFGSKSFFPVVGHVAHGPVTGRRILRLCRQNPKLSALVFITAPHGIKSTKWHADVPKRRIEKENGRVKVSIISNYYIVSCQKILAPR